MSSVDTEQRSGTPAKKARSLDNGSRNNWARYNSSLIAYRFQSQLTDKDLVTEVPALLKPDAKKAKRCSLVVGLRTWIVMCKNRNTLSSILTTTSGQQNQNSIRNILLLSI